MAVEPDDAEVMAGARKALDEWLEALGPGAQPTPERVGLRWAELNETDAQPMDPELHNPPPEWAFRDVRGPRYIDRRGQALTVFQWRDLSEDLGYASIGHSRLHHLRIITLWLGFGFTPYQTLVMPMRHRDKSQIWAHTRWHWHTDREARLGHLQIVDRIRQGGVYCPFRLWGRSYRGR